MNALTANYTEPFGPHDPFGPEILIDASPDYVPRHESVPLYAHQWLELLAQCRSALARRRAAYPRLIERGEIQPDLAQRDIAAWELLVAEWRWVVSGQGAPPPRYTIADRVAAIDLAMIRVSQEIDRGSRSHDIYRQAHLIAALQWHLVHQADGEPQVYFVARVNHTIRKEQAARWCELCDRWQGGQLAFDCTRTDCGRPEWVAA